MLPSSLARPRWRGPGPLLAGLADTLAEADAKAWSTQQQSMAQRAGQRTAQEGATGPTAVSPPPPRPAPPSPSPSRGEPQDGPVMQWLKASLQAGIQALTTESDAGVRGSLVKPLPGATQARASAIAPSVGAQQQGSGAVEAMAGGPVEVRTCEACRTDGRRDQHVTRAGDACDVCLLCRVGGDACGRAHTPDGPWSHPADRHQLPAGHACTGAAGAGRQPAGRRGSHGRRRPHHHVQPRRPVQGVRRAARASCCVSPRRRRRRRRCRRCWSAGWRWPWRAAGSGARRLARPGHHGRHAAARLVSARRSR